MTDVDLHPHGDRDVRPGLVDLAVNVRLAAPPPWLGEVIAATIGGLGAYPNPAAATAAVAARHRVPEEAVLPTAGGAEACSLVARALPELRRRGGIRHRACEPPVPAGRRAVAPLALSRRSWREGLQLVPRYRFSVEE